MKKIVLSLLVLLALSAQAKNVLPTTAENAARNYIRQNKIGTQYSQLELAHTYSNGTADLIFVFNIDTTGFILVSADDRATPILGYSLEGRFQFDQLPENFKQWVESYASSIAFGIEHNAFKDKSAPEKWGLLEDGTIDSKPEAKNVNALISSQWGQGYGYDQMCPAYGWGHAVVGCGATAMAQVIRYYQYPTNGFGSKSYRCSPYGLLSADFYGSTYNYSLMPDQLDYYSSTAEINAVSLLCYHCGVALSMTYESDEYPSGSGSQSTDIPDAFTYFGYFTAEYHRRTADDEAWKTMLRNELDEARPIIYCGYTETSGHAFICDGYRSNDQTFHFNWGWEGYCDGFYQLDNMCDELNLNQEAITNIIPSKFASHTDIIHISEDGTGDGSSWEHAHNDLLTAVSTIAPLIEKPIWVKAGSYTGDTSQNTMLTITSGTSIYGGFNGSETSLDQRDIANNPTILDGQNVQSVVTIANQSLACVTHIEGFTIKNGISDYGHAFYSHGKTMCADLTFIDNHGGETSPIEMINGGTFSRCSFIGNQSTSAPVIMSNNSNIKNSLIAHNEGPALMMQNNSKLIESTIVANNGTAVTTSNANSISGCILWGNQGNITTNGTTAPTIDHTGIDSADCPAGTGNIALDSDNGAANGPHFINPGERGSDNWRLDYGSPCINAGATQISHADRTDITGNERIQNGQADMGCYESSHTAGISEAEIGNLLVYPNPTSEYIRLDTSRPTTLSIFDAAGKCLLRQKVNVGQTTIDFRSYPSGIYYIQMGKKSTKIVRQ